MIDEFDGIVIGSGHAGIEAAFALAHKKHTVALFTLNKEGIAQTPCNGTNNVSSVDFIPVDATEEIGGDIHMTVSANLSDAL